MKIQIEDLEAELEDIKKCQGINGKKYKLMILKGNDNKTITKKNSNNTKNVSIIKKLKNENEHLRKLVVTYKLKNRKYEISADKSLKKSLYNINHNYNRTLKNIRQTKASSNNINAFSSNNISIIDSINYINTVNNTMIYANNNNNNEMSANFSRTKLYHKKNKSNEKIKSPEAIFKKTLYDSNNHKNKNMKTASAHKTIFVNNTNNLSNIKKLYFSNSNSKVILTNNKSTKTMKFISKTTTLNPTIENSESYMKNYILHRYKKFASKKNNHWVKENETKNNTLVTSPNATFSKMSSSNTSNIFYNKNTEFPNILRNNVNSFTRLPFQSKKIELKRKLTNKRGRDTNNSLDKKNSFNTLMSSGKQSKHNNICNNVLNKQNLINKNKIKIDENNLNNNNYNKESNVKYVKNFDLISASNINSFDNENKNFLNFKDSKYNTANKENKNSENNIHFKKKIIKNSSIVNKFNILNNSNKNLMQTEKTEHNIFLGK